MKKYLLIIFIAFLACNKLEKTQEENILPLPIEQADTLKGNFIAVIDPKFKLTETEKKQVGNLLLKGVQKYNLKHKGSPIDLRFYKRQYFPKLSVNGDKLVEIFCMCSTIGEDWKTGLIQVNDGGKCYFKISINISTNEYSEIVTHGRA